jgi:2-polyprenyl-6-methoxyphenol hydroxylase-like FAD-dependent oxidoreductase
MAIEDAFLLGILLAQGRKMHAKDGHQEAFYRYFNARYPYTSRIAKESYQQSKLGQWSHPFLVMLREFLLRKVPASLLQKKLKNVNLWKVEPWLEEFRAMYKST